MILVIDDERRFKFDSDPGKNVFYLSTLSAAVCSLFSAWTQQYKANGYGEALEELWLDHDLGLNETSGWCEDVTIIVDWLVALAQQGCPLRVKTVFVHSQNPVGASNIRKALSPHYHVRQVPLPDLWPAGD